MTGEGKGRSRKEHQKWRLLSIHDPSFLSGVASQMIQEPGIVWEALVCSPTIQNPDAPSRGGGAHQRGVGRSAYLSSGSLQRGMAIGSVTKPSWQLIPLALSGPNHWLAPELSLQKCLRGHPSHQIPSNSGANAPPTTVPPTYVVPKRRSVSTRRPSPHRERSPTPTPPTPPSTAHPHGPRPGARGPRRWPRW